MYDKNLCDFDFFLLTFVSAKHRKNQVTGEKNTKWFPHTVDGMVVKEETCTNNSRQTNKRWNEIYEFFTLRSRLREYVCVCLDVPLDGINNNKAKLRESLITISRFHLTTLAIHREKRVAILTMPLPLPRVRCEMCNFERDAIYFGVTIKLSVGFHFAVASRCSNYCVRCHVLITSSHSLANHSGSLLSLFHIPLIFTKLFGGNIIVNCNFFHNIFMWVFVWFALFSESVSAKPFTHSVPLSSPADKFLSRQ